VFLVLVLTTPVAADWARDTLYVPTRVFQALNGQSHKKPIAPVRQIWRSQAAAMSQLLAGR
jgi:hypothetical protein